MFEAPKQVERRLRAIALMMIAVLSSCAAGG